MLLLNPLPQRLDSGATPTFAGLLAADGTAAAPSISFASAPTNGIYYAGGNEVGISNNGILRWKSTYASATNHRFQANGGGYLDATSNGAIGLTAAGTDQNITLTPSGTGYVSVSDANWDISSALFSMEVKSSATVASGRGGSIGLGGFFDGSTQSTFAGIAGQKESAVSGETGGMFTVHTRANGGPMVERARILSNGRFLLGTTTDSGALLQIGTNTTNTAGGMVFGTDTFLYRNQAGGLRLDTAGATPALSFAVSATQKSVVYWDNNTSIFYLIGFTGSTVLQSNGATALTLDASQNALFAGDVATANAKAFYWGTRSVMTSPSDGVIRLANSAGTDFTRLQFGGTTASFPALRRVGTALGVRLADDSGDGGFTAGTIVASSCVNISGAAASVAAGVVSYGGTTATTVGAAGGASLLPATPLGYIIVNVGGTAAKIPYYNS